MGDTVTIYDLEIEEERFERIQERIEELDQSRKYGKKHIAKTGLQLLDHLLDKEMEEVNSSITQAERRIDKLKEITKTQKD